MSVARHHSEWLSLIEVSAPFLSMPVLLQAWTQGLDAHDSELLQMLRLAYEEWEDNQQGLQPDLAIHRAWVEWVLRETLGFPNEVLVSGGQSIPTGLQVTMAEHQETLRPDWVILHPNGTPDAGRPQLLMQIVPINQDIEYFNLNPQKGNHNQLPIVSCAPLLQEARAKRRELESFTVNDIHDLQRKEELLREAELALDQVRFIGDLLIGKGLTQSGRTGDEADYGWQDLDLGHGFHETKQGLRYTISEPARREVLDRLLQLNHQRYAEEVAAGLHDKGKTSKKKKRNNQILPRQMNLL